MKKAKKDFFRLLILFYFDIFAINQISHLKYSYSFLIFYHKFFVIVLLSKVDFDNKYLLILLAIS